MRETETIWEQLAVHTADALARTGLGDRLVAGLAGLCGLVPAALSGWPRDAIAAPGNGRAPSLTPGEPGLWSGLVVVNKNECAAWLLVRVGQPMSAGSRSLGRGDGRPTFNDEERETAKVDGLPWCDGHGTG